MKQYAILAFMLLLMLGSNVSAQNCENIVLPHVGNSTAMLDNMPEAKVIWYCSYSHNCFFVTDQVPQDAEIHNISEVQDRFTNEFLPSDFVVDLDNLSFYAYTFSDFQVRAHDHVVYFTTPGSEHQYLAVRTNSDAMRLTDQEIDIYSYGDILHGEVNQRNQDNH